jgi:hypothetical protein
MPKASRTRSAKLLKKAAKLAKGLHETIVQKNEAEAAEAPAFTYQLLRFINGVQDSANTFDLDETEFEYLSDFRTIIAANGGSDTPVEAFIVGLHYHAQQPLTIAQIEHGLNEAKHEFSDLVRASKKLMKDYPNLFMPDAAALKHIKDTSKLAPRNETRDERVERLGFLVGSLVHGSSDEKLDGLETLLVNAKAALGE